MRLPGFLSRRGPLSAALALALAPTWGAGAPPGAAPPGIEQTAERGDLDAQYRLGEKYMYGQGADKDVARGLAWWRKAAAHGHIQAQWQLGFVHEMGRVVPRDDRQAAAWYRRAATHPGADPESSRFKAAAQFKLGQMLIEGRGVRRDTSAGLAMLGQAAESGDPHFQWMLGEQYAQGQVTARDDQRALLWFRRAADQGDGNGQLALGRAYAEGRGVAVDKPEAARWYLAAAQTGAYGARLPLALAYHHGDGVPRDDAAAYLWAWKALETARPAPAPHALLEALEKTMTPQEIADARERADAYRPGSLPR
jgi:uncharacterized protein